MTSVSQTAELRMVGGLVDNEQQSIQVKEFVANKEVK